MGENEFFNNILEDPENIPLRLVFADWLEEHGQPDRAEFIRIQCEPSQSVDAVRRQDELLRRWEDEWREPYDDLPGRLVFRCGMPEGIDIDTDSFLRNAQELFERLPLLHVQLRNVSRGLDAFLRSEWPSGLRSLSLRGEQLSIEEVGQLVHAPSLENLIELDLSGTVLCAKRVGALAQTSSLTGLDKLILEDTRLRAASLKKLVQSPVFRQLSQIWITASDFSQEEWATLMESQVVGRSLRVRSRDAPKDSDALLQQVAGSPVAQVWTRVVVTDRRTLDAVLDSPHFRNVRELCLRMHGKHEKALLQRLSHSSLYQQLRRLEVRYGSWPADILEILAAAPEPARFRSLELPTNKKITTRGLTAMRAAGQLRGIESLVLGGTGCGPTLTALLCDHDDFVDLRRLDVSHLNGGDKILRGVGKKAPFQLQHVVAYGIRIDESTAKWLTRSPAFASLLSLRASRSQVTELAREMLRNRFGQEVFVLDST